MPTRAEPDVDWAPYFALYGFFMAASGTAPPLMTAAIVLYGPEDLCEDVVHRR